MSIKVIEFQLQKERSRRQVIPTETAEKEKTAFGNAAFSNESSYDPRSLIEITSDDKQDSTDSKLNENVGKKEESLSTWDPESKR